MRNGNKTTKLVDSSALSCNSKYHFLFARFDASYEQRGMTWCVCVCVCLALVVKYITKRFIMEYDPYLG